MYYPYKDGSIEIIQGYECQVPKPGYGKNRLTGKEEYVGIVKRSSKKDEQYWERLVLPDDWDKRSKAEAKKQADDPEYFDHEMEDIRANHWKHRLCGYWLMINGKTIYLPPSYFVYINYCQLDVGYPAYRDTDRQFFYVWEYCCEDHRCAGLADIERRRMGKTYKSGSILLDRTSIYKNHHGGIQSKTSTDAKQVFLKSVVTFFKKFPNFYRPVFDQSKGVTPTTELRFFQTVKKGRRAEEIIGAEELESWIDWGSSDIFHYDGSKLNTYVMDEFGKTNEINVWDRWNVVRFCLDQDGEWCGKALLVSTIEDLDNGGSEARKIWDASNPDKRDANGRTESGLYRFFLPAFETTYFDKFGMPLVEKAKEFYLNQRAGLQDDPRALSSIIRKAPFTIEEAFRIDGEQCLFNAMKLNIRLDYLSWNQKFTSRYDLIWKDGERFTEIEVKENKAAGRFEMPVGFIMKEPNRVVKRNDNFYPNNTFMFRMGADPFKFGDVKDKSRASDGAALCYKMDDPVDRINPFNDAFICRYRYRAPTTDMQYEDMLKMAWYFGCQILFESNVDSWKEYFRHNKCYNFLMVLPGEQEPGIYNDGGNKVKQTLANYINSYVENYVDKIFFKSLVKELLEFDIIKSTPFDEVMGMGFALIAARDKLYKRTIESTKDISDYFRQYKAS